MNYTIASTRPLRAAIFAAAVLAAGTGRAAAQVPGDVTGTAPSPTPTPNPTAAGIEEKSFALPGGVPLTMVKIPRGSFLMGSPQSEVDAGWAYSWELPQHSVTIGYDYYMGKYELTQRQWVAVMGTDPSIVSPANPQGQSDITLDSPVDHVSWNDIQLFEAAVNGLGLGGTFRLPSEAEWEYAARGGTQTRFSFGDSTCSRWLPCTDCDLSAYAWWLGTNSPLTVHHGVGSKLPNAYGLYDTAGNVWEWCEDWHHGSYMGAPSDGSAWVSPAGSFRMVRGGSSVDLPWTCRPAFRVKHMPGFRDSIIGFRLAWTP